LWHQNTLSVSNAVASGWGQTAFGKKNRLRMKNYQTYSWFTDESTSNVLLKVGLKIIDNSVCRDVYQDERYLQDGFIDSQLCFGDLTGGKDTCQVNISNYYINCHYSMHVYFSGR
jgi:hypothetical protein